MRAALVAVVILLPSWLAGCDRHAADAEGAAFEARCHALPGLAPTVVALPIVPQHDETRCAHEVARDECRRAAVREHEMKHVAVYEAYMRDAVARLARTLPEALPERVHYAADAAAAQADLARALSAFLEQFQAQDSDDIAMRQAEVDSPSEYARVAAACTAPR